MIWQQYLWSEWEIVNEIGSGSYGTVYKIRREDASGVYFAALKVMIISVKDELIGVSARKLNPGKAEAATSEEIVQDSEKSEHSDNYMGFAKEISNEISFMEKFKGNSNVVSYEDHRIIFDDESKSWIVLLRMELLQTLADYFSNGNRDEKDVVNLGIDICNALHICEEEGVLHRDVKPGNIFVSDFGNFKLGDFGIAFITRSTRTMREPIGTHDYMAPEVVKEKMYNRTVDLYSLGLIMYKILNGGVPPFLSSDKKNISTDMRRNADERRLNGEPLPELPGTAEELLNIILKACSFDPRNRYQTAEEMGDALKEYKRNLKMHEIPQKKMVRKNYFMAAGEL